MIKIGINGFGRVGRAIFRQTVNCKKFRVAAINDLDNDINNHAYLLKYDTTYGRLNNKVGADKNFLWVDSRSYPFYSNTNISCVPWDSHDVDLVIDASGVAENVCNSRVLLANSNIKKIILTHAPSKNIDITLIHGVNIGKYDYKRHHLISSSICDANAVAPFFKTIDDAFGIDLAEVTTLHPWLQYQNLLDGTVTSISSPGHFWKDYALGRSSVGSLIPKDTTLVKALNQVLPGISERMHAASFRTPTSIVSAAEGVFLLSRNSNISNVIQVLEDFCKVYPGVLLLDGRSKISVDYVGVECAAIVDTRWLHLNGGKLLKFVLWYDNEWGYASRALKVAELSIR
jgi:glyceraldehyde 3-phosphate dehydrogenase